MTWITMDYMSQDSLRRNRAQVPTLFTLSFSCESLNIMVHQVIVAIATGIGLLTEPGWCFEGPQNGFEQTNWKEFL